MCFSTEDPVTAKNGIRSRAAYEAPCSISSGCQAVPRTTAGTWTIVRPHPHFPLGVSRVRAVLAGSSGSRDNMMRAGGWFVLVACVGCAKAMGGEPRPDDEPTDEPAAQQVGPEGPTAESLDGLPT